MQSQSYFAFVVIFASAMLIGHFTSAQETAETDDRTQLQELMIQRRDVLKQLVEVLENKFSQGLCKIDPVLAARGQLLNAELELATTKKERLEILQKRIDNMRELEDSLKIRHQAGETTLETWLSATVARLKAEIELVREKQQPHNADKKRMD